MTCSLLNKMEQDGTRWNKMEQGPHVPWNPSTWFCDPSPPCPKLLPLPTSEPKGGRIPGLNPTIDPSITTTISELPCHQIRSISCMWRPPIPSKISKSKGLRKLRRQLFGVRGRALGHGIQNLQQFQEFLLCILSCKASQVTKVTQNFQNAAGSPFFDFLNCLSEANIDTYSNGSGCFFFHILRSSPTFWPWHDTSLLDSPPAPRHWLQSALRRSPPGWWIMRRQSFPLQKDMTDPNSWEKPRTATYFLIFEWKNWQKKPENLRALEENVNNTENRTIFLFKWIFQLESSHFFTTWWPGMVDAWWLIDDDLPVRKLT